MEYLRKRWINLGNSKLAPIIYTWLSICSNSANKNPLPVYLIIAELYTETPQHPNTFNKIWFDENNRLLGWTLRSNMASSSFDTNWSILNGIMKNQIQASLLARCLDFVQILANHKQSRSSKHGDQVAGTSYQVRWYPKSRKSWEIIGNSFENYCWSLLLFHLLVKY